MRTITHFVDNEPEAAIGDETFYDIDPFTREPWARVSRGGPGDVDRAVAAARRAFDGGWAKASASDRGEILDRLAALIDQHASELAGLETRDMGKPIYQARHADLPRTAQHFRFFADYARMAGDQVFLGSAAHHVYSRHEPVGVVAAISPWNFPLMLASWKVAPALAFGNTVVLKPAEQTPASALRLAELAAEAGMPPGTLNVVQGFGHGEVGEALTHHKDVDLVTFTGESSTGRAVLSACASGLKRVSLELGGKAPNIVFADANLEAAIDCSLRAAFANAGQVCLAGSRIYVERPACEEFTARLTACAAAMLVGDPADEATEVGPLASGEHFGKVAEYLREAQLGGARILTGGVAEGWFIRPTVIVDVDAKMRICRDEVFGPVVTVQPFDTEEEAVALANDTPYGLSALIFTEGLRRAHRVAGRLRAGTVWINCFNIRDLRAPFGGMGDSGLGREGGAYSREFFTEPKTVFTEF